MEEMNLDQGSSYGVDSNRSSGDRDWLFENETLRIGTLPGNVGPFVQKIETKDGNVYYQGLVLEILNKVSEKLHFKYELVLPPDGQYGVAQANGSFTGMVGMLQRGEIDVVASDLTVTFSRSQVIDFSSSPFYYDSIGILINAPNSTAPLDLWAWFNPFSWSLWLCFLGAFSAASAVLYGGHSFFGPELWAHEKFRRLGTCAAYVMGGYVNKCVTHVSPTSWWAQVLLTFWWLICLLEVACYGSFLMAAMTAPIPAQLPFYNLVGLAALVKKGDYKVCVRTGTSFSQAVMDGRSEEYQILAQFLKTNPTYVRPGQGGCVQLMQTETGVAYLAELFVIEAFQKRLCQQQKMIVLKDDFYTIAYSLGFRKNSSLTQPFTLEMLNLVERGLSQVWYQNYSRTSDLCTIVNADDIGVVQASMNRLSLRDLFSVFLLFDVGILVSIFALPIEMAVRRIGKNVRVHLKNGSQSWSTK